MASVSVIIPAYNRQRLIVRAIQSVMEQTVPVAEVIVVDDGSTDDTVRVVRGTFPSVRIVQLEKNSGAQAARAAGIREAAGDWIAFHDSDDEWLPEKIEWQLQKASEGFPVVHGPAFICKDGHKERYSLPPLEGEVYASLLQRPGTLYPSIMAKRECFEIAGHPDPTILAYQEWDMSLALARYFPFGYVENPLFVYVVRSDSISRDNLRGVHGYEQIVRKWWPEILATVGSDAGYAHYALLAEWALARDDFKGAKRFIVTGARLTGRNLLHCLLRSFGPYCKGRMWRHVARLGKRIPGAHRAYRAFKNMWSQRG